ncbi:MAG: hypothetical protein KJ626_00595 [Verrucomicrobia bacterium]|nr:hypothetical protein [Verrucomicrobiota bacterium]
MSVSKQDRVKLIVLGVVLICLLAFIFSNMRGAKSGSRSYLETASANQSSAQVLESLAQTLDERRGALMAKAKAGPAPIEQRSAEDDEVEVVRDVNLRLTGVILEDAQPLAFINGDVVGLNEKIGPWTVTGIQTDRVVFTDDNGRDKIIMLYSE